MSEENEKPKEDRTPGRVSWNELVSTDAEGSAAFYGGLFGWSHESMDMPNGMTYHMFNNGGMPAAGMIQMPPEVEEAKVPTHWMTYVTVENVVQSLAKALTLGARQVKGVTETPMGSFAIIADPQGACISLWQFAEDGCD